MNWNIPLPVRIATTEGSYELRTAEDMERFAAGTLPPVSSSEDE